MLRQIPEIQFQRSSAIYETEPVSSIPQGNYLNAVWEIKTTLQPSELLKKTLAVEAILGRERRIPDSPRTIDIDILFYGDKIYQVPGLTIPHPKLHERFFVLRPLMDLCPDRVHPRLEKTINALWESCKDLHEVNRS